MTDFAGLPRILRAIPEWSLRQSDWTEESRGCAFSVFCPAGSDGLQEKESPKSGTALRSNQRIADICMIPIGCAESSPDGLGSEGGQDFQGRIISKSYHHHRKNKKSNRTLARGDKRISTRVGIGIPARIV